MSCLFFVVTNNLNTFIWINHKVEAATRGVLWKKVLLEILQNSQENTCARASFLLKMQASDLDKNTLLNEHLWTTDSLQKMYCRTILIFGYS